MTDGYIHVNCAFAIFCPYIYTYICMYVISKYTVYIYILCSCDPPKILYHSQSNIHQPSTPGVELPRATWFTTTKRRPETAAPEANGKPNFKRFRKAQRHGPSSTTLHMGLSRNRVEFAEECHLKGGDDKTTGFGVLFSNQLWPNWPSIISFWQIPLPFRCQARKIDLLWSSCHGHLLWAVWTSSLRSRLWKLRARSRAWPCEYWLSRDLWG